MWYAEYYGKEEYEPTYNFEMLREHLDEYFNVQMLEGRRKEIAQDLAYLRRAKRDSTLAGQNVIAMMSKFLSQIDARVKWLKEQKFVKWIVVGHGTIRKYDRKTETFYRDQTASIQVIALPRGVRYRKGQLSKNFESGTINATPVIERALFEDNPPSNHTFLRPVKDVPTVLAELTVKHTVPKGRVIVEG